MLPFVYRRLGFMGSREAYRDADLVLLGVPMDYTVSFQPGSRFGPQAIRSVSDALEEYSFYQHGSLAEVAFFDAGDVDLPFGNVEASLERIRAVARAVHGDGKIPIALGGEHLVTLPLVQAAKEFFPELAVFHFDAHADLREEYLGEKLSHATVMYQVANLVGPDHLYQFGIRSGTAEEYRYGQERTNFFPHAILDPLQQVIDRWDGRPVYVSIDIDVVDPAFAPGTGTPEPGGCSSEEMLQALLLLMQLPVVAMDIVEVLPAQDVSQRTALLAAKLVREALIGFHLRKEKTFDRKGTV
ncbi:MAG TPA: agmatinase [Clostridia bacterium]|nr:agmatinase [Clostridia bacterium]